MIVFTLLAIALAFLTFAHEHFQHLLDDDGSGE